MNQSSSSENTKADTLPLKCKRETIKTFKKTKKSSIKINLQTTKINLQTISSENNNPLSHFLELVEFLTSNHPSLSWLKNSHFSLSLHWFSKVQLLVSLDPIVKQPSLLISVKNSWFNNLQLSFKINGYLLLLLIKMKWENYFLTKERKEQRLDLSKEFKTYGHFSLKDHSFLLW